MMQLPKKRLTIYEDGKSLVSDRRIIQLDAGLNNVSFFGIPSKIDPVTVMIESLAEPNGLTILEQGYRHDVLDIEVLLRYCNGEIVEVLSGDQHFKGQLLRSFSTRVNDFEQLILLIEDSQIVYIDKNQISSLRFLTLPGDFVQHPTLYFLLQSDQSGSQELQITYLTEKMVFRWEADYNIHLASDNRSIDLRGQITLQNLSGAAFIDAQVKVVSGEFDLGLPEPIFALRDSAETHPRPVRPVEQRKLSEYRVYEIKHPVTLADGETKQIEFLTANKIPASILYYYPTDVRRHFSREPNFDADVRTSYSQIQTWLRFSTGKQNGLGADLLRGRIRVYQNDTDGSNVLIGGNRIASTPEGETIEIRLGTAFDLVGERKQTNFLHIGENILEESFEIRLRNRKTNESVEILVQERLFRWSNWEILRASESYTKLDVSTIEFRPQVAPGEEKIITYTARYSW